MFASAALYTKAVDCSKQLWQETDVQHLSYLIFFEVINDMKHSCSLVSVYIYQVLSVNMR